MAAVPQWRADSHAPLVWRTWNDESVVLHPRSGNTHLLDLVAAQALRCLEQQPLTAEELSRQLSAALEVEHNDQLRTYVDQLLNRFDELGLLERVPG